VTRRPPVFLLVGYFGARNVGDDVILQVVHEQLAARLGPVELLVPAQDTEALPQDPSIHRLRWLDAAALADAIERCDAVIVGGGGLFHDYGPTAPEWILSPLHHRLGFFAGLPWLAARAGKPTFVLSVGVGPLEFPESRDLVRAVAERAALVTVRDRESAREMAACGVPLDRVEVAADPAWLARIPEDRPGAQPPPGRRWVGVVLRRWPGLGERWYEGVLAGAASLARRLDAGLLLVPFQRLASTAENDLALARRPARASVNVPIVVAREPEDAAEAMGVLARCELVIAMRYHALLAAFRAGRPTVAIAYDPKIEALCTDPDLGDPPPILQLAEADAERIAREGESALARSGRRGAAVARWPRLARRAALPFDRIAELLSAPSGGRREPGVAVELQLVRETARRAAAVGLVENALLRDIADRLPPATSGRGSEPDATGGEGEGLTSRYVSRLLALRSAAAAALADARSEIRALRAEANAWREAHAEARAVRERLEAELERLRGEVQRAREEVEAWKRAHDSAREGIAHLQRELEAWRSSKFGRLASLYWRTRERLARALRPGDARAPGEPRGEARDRDASSEGAPRVPAPRRAPCLPEEMPKAPRGRYDVIVLSIIDWDFRFQRPQQIAAQFGRHGHRVFYLSTSTFLRPSDPRPAELVPKASGVFEARIRAPRQLDIYSGSLSSEDTSALADALEELAEAACVGDAALMVQIPFWAPLAEELRRRRGWRVIYDCMDEWTNFPGFGKAVLDLEDDLVASADLTVVSGETLETKFRGRARRLLLAKNAVDTEHYRRLYRENDLLRDVPHPIIGYFGALASWVDVPLLERIADEFPEATVVLAGGEFDVNLEPLRRRRNVRLLGQRPYDEMPQLLWHFDVCIIPFQINEITHATNPVKLYEYCYSGKPVVAPDLRELRPFADVCYLSDTHEGFLAHLRAALAEPEDDPRREARRRIAAGNDWSERYRAIDAELRAAYPLVSVVVVTYDGWEHTRRCLESLLESETWPRLEVIVVDNASRDGTPERLREIEAREPRLRVIRNPENRGFAAANNQGMAAARGDIVVLLNNDTVVPPGLLGRLVHHLESDGTIGLLCPTTNFCGNEALVEPGYETLDGLIPYAAWRARAHRGETVELGVAAMYCVAARREVLEAVGPLDEEFGIGMFEDDDYSLRVREAGYRVVCAEDAYVHHVGQASFSTLSPEEYRRVWRRNQEYFERKWGRPWRPHRPRRGVTPVRPKIGAEAEPPAAEPEPAPTPGPARPRSDEGAPGDRERMVEWWSTHLCDPRAFSSDVYWAALPAVQRRLREKLSPGGDRRWFEYCVLRYLGDRIPVERMASLGCGTGGLERQLAELGAFRRCDAFDITPAAIEEARRRAAEAGIDSIEYRVADIEELELAAGAYDAVWFSGSLHHVSRLERVLGRVAEALRPDGYLFLFEYVGPSRFAFTERQVEVLRAAFELIPERFRRAYIPGYPHETLRAPQIPDPRRVAEADPSEAVRSGEILEVLRQRFEIVEQIDLGGTILQFLLAGIAGNFRDDERDAMRVLDLLFAIEDTLIAVGDLASDFAVVIARPRRAAGG